MQELSDQERAVLDFERNWWHRAGRREAAIRDQFGVTATVYAQLLYRLLGRPEAAVYAPDVVNRLRRVLAKGRAQRVVPFAAMTD